ncbi:hypothetical protein CANINC_001481 [Pichia inconspicua]|uniref:Cysteine protease n=1 Tax=Pichia inconspicua TaxID=52247 RepID=A0A4V4NFZ3_9ASCO|nr:hypothetical protein CANINC_001481 [[Candida] inconspicua]
MSQDIKPNEVFLLGEAYQLDETNDNLLRGKRSYNNVLIHESIVKSPVKRTHSESAYVYCEVNDCNDTKNNTDNNTYNSAQEEYEVPGQESDAFHALGHETDTATNLPKKAFDDIVSFFSNISHSQETADLQLYPPEFLEDLKTRISLTYRYGFPLIEKDKNGPNPLSLGSLFRGTLDLSTINKGFTTDSGWGCMIRTSQSLVANSLLICRLGRSWRICDSTVEELETHWNIIAQFADTPEAVFSIHNFVAYANKHCGTKVGEWFGPSNAAKSIQKICEDYSEQIGLKVYLSNGSGDIFEQDVLPKHGEPFAPLLILCGVRLGVKSANEIYWEFLKFLLTLPYFVGIAGGRPSSSHYFLGFQSDHLLYLDPHTAQQAILLDRDQKISDEEKRKIFSSIHNLKLQKVHLSKIDPSMLIGFLIQTNEQYDDFKQKLTNFSNENKFISIQEKNPEIFTINSTGSDLDGFVDLGVQSMDESEDEHIVNQTTETGYYNRDDSELIEIEESVIIRPPSSAEVIDLDNPYLKEEPSEFVNDETIEKESLIIVFSEEHA